MVGSLWGLINHLGLFYVDCEVIAVTGVRYLIHPFYLFSSVGAPFAMSSAKKNSSSTSVCNLDLTSNLLRLKSFPSKRYHCHHPRTQLWAWQRTSCYNRVAASTQPCLTPFVTGNGSENSPSWNMPSWNCLTIAMNLEGQSNFAIIFQRPSQLIVSNVLVRSTKVM